MIKRLLCWLGFHNWHELYDPEEYFQNTHMCVWCTNFKGRPKQTQEDIERFIKEISGKAGE